MTMERVLLGDCFVALTTVSVPEDEESIREMELALPASTPVVQLLNCMPCRTAMKQWST